MVIVESRLLAFPFLQVIELLRRRRCLGEPRILGPADDQHVDLLGGARHQRPSAPRRRRARVDAVEPVAAVVHALERVALGCGHLVAFSGVRRARGGSRTR